jgi:ornithine cyclodeaminase/alanine dehydrogenase-like protein (mu-crystallin family)
MIGEMKDEAPHALSMARSLPEACRASDVIVTCTTSKSPVLHQGEVSPGAFVAAVGADNEEKHEIDPALMARSRVITDITDQCARIGDLHHAIEAGVMSQRDVHAELGEVLAGSRPGRMSESETVIFDSTGAALQDVAAAALVYERALAAGRGVPFSF